MNNFLQGQMNIFDFLENPNKEGGGVSRQVTIDKPIRLIELFAG